MNFENFLSESSGNDDHLFKHHILNSSHTQHAQGFTPNADKHLTAAHKIAHTPERKEAVQKAAKKLISEKSNAATAGIHNGNKHQPGGRSIDHHRVVGDAMHFVKKGMLDTATAKKTIDHHMASAHKAMQTPGHKASQPLYVQGQHDEHEAMKKAVEKFHKKHL